MEDNQLRQFKDTTATKKIFQLTKRIRAVAGVTSASKTISILIWIIDYCHSVPNEIATVVSESFPHLSGGSIRDFQSIMKSNGYWDDTAWNETKHFYTFPNKTVLEFMSFDKYGKAHGPRRDILFLNEANNIPYLIVDQLITRTRKVVWMDWNPSEEFYFYTEMLPNRTDIDFITLTYLDNEALDFVSIAEIESHKNNVQWWTVYGEGKLGVITSRIYKDWAFIEEVPHEARLISYGLDFGYTNDPTAICAIYYLNGGYVVDEIAYTKGFSNKQIADIILALPAAPVIADSAEPKSIDELRLYGLTMINATKGKGSVSQGIAFVQAQKISLTNRSVNFKKSYRNYLFATDKNGVITNDPIHYMSDGMDAVRYGLQIKQTLIPYVPYVQLPYEHPGLQEVQSVETPQPLPFTPHRS